MITDKKLGLVIAENENEAAWWNVIDSIKYDIKMLKMRNVNSEKDLKLSAREIEQKFKAGAKLSIKRNKMTITVQREFLKFAESKLK